MTLFDDLRYQPYFDALLAQEGIADPEVFTHVEAYDKLPLYSRLHYLEFLSDLSVAEQNRQLIRAAVRHLDRIREYFLAHPRPMRQRVITWVSITDWWVDDLERGGGVCTDGTSELICPYLCIGNLDNERMKEFRLYRPTSRCAAFVSDVVRATRCDVFESELTEPLMWCPNFVDVVFSEDIPSQLLR